MTAFTTPVEVHPFPWKSDYTKSHLMIGSCFTESIGAKMEALKFNTGINPFGILYNPLSMADALERLITAFPFRQEELFRHNGLWHSYHHHGRFSGTNPGETLSLINDGMESGSQFLKEADFLLLTFGTAWVYELKSTGTIVANCHKVPAREFRRYRLTVAETVARMRDVFQKLWDVNPGIRIILTVSPVRHTQDGATENQLSKAALLLAAEALVNGFGAARCSYFPAYEIMMDELRDYRFYAGDMIHPSDVAVNHIWEKFSNAFFTEETLEISRKITMVRKAMDHRPVNSGSHEFRLFVENSLRNITQLAINHPNLDFSAEIHYFSELIKSESEK